MSTRVHVEHVKGAVYPKWQQESCYGPSKRYPEFVNFRDMILTEDNQVYEMVRNTLVALGLDSANIGTEEWNPFSEMIHCGDTVLVKPNMVHHKNGNEEEGTDCLVTHPSIVRVVLDYVVLALKEGGKIILADAPVQSCDFSILVRELHYDKLVEYYAGRGITVELMDLRQLDEAYIKSIDKSALFTAKNEDVVVRLGQDSAFCAREQIEESVGNLRITNYLPARMAEYHNDTEHMYSVARAVMEADVIINLPKPKTHRKAGMTASLKNMVGCVAKKECLPHHTKGSKSEKGDEYLQSSVFKRWRTSLQEYKDKLTATEKKIPGYISFVERVLGRLQRMQSVDKYSEGSWYGNDTLWRTICDLCRIVMYADKKGVMTDEKQRNMFILADMIVAGEGEGPLLPGAKPVGALVGGWEQIAVDKTIAALMGFDSDKFPSIKNASFGERYVLPDSEVQISSNDGALHGRTPEQIRVEADPFVPTSGWKEWLEN